MVLFAWLNFLAPLSDRKLTSHFITSAPSQAVEGSLAGLEVSQSEGMRRLALHFNNTLTDAESMLQVKDRRDRAGDERGRRGGDRGVIGLQFRV